MATVKEIFALVVQADVSGGAAAIKSFASGAKQEFKGVEGGAQQMYASLARGGAQVAAAGAAGLAALTALGLSARKTAGDVLAIQRVSGGSAEEVSKLRFAAQQTGVELSDLSTGLLRLSRSASSDKGATTLARYGIEARDAAGQVRPLGDLLSDVAGAVSALPNGAEKNDLVLSIFGRGGASLIPLLNRGADGIDALGVKAGEFGAVLTGETLDAAKRYTAAQRDMNAAVDGLKVSIGKDVLPTLTSVNEALASVASGAARGFESLPEGLRQTAVSGGLAASTLASVGGTIASTLGSYGLAAQGLASLKAGIASVGGLGAAFSSIGGPIALATVALAGFISALVQLDDQQKEVTDLYATSAARIAQAFDPRVPQEFGDIARQVAEDLAKSNEVGPADFGDRARNLIGLYGEAEEATNRQAVAETTLKRIREEIANQSPAQAGRFLDEVNRQMIAAGASAREAKATLKPLYDQIGSTGPVDEGASAMQRYADAVEAASKKGVTLKDALNGLKDGVDPGELTVYADSLGASLDPVFGLIDANQRLSEAQKKAATSAKRDTSEIESAYKRLVGAKQRLDDVLKGDGEDRRQVSPEVQIADARRRILEANARIAQNPLDNAALSLRDEALADLDRATNRRQQLNKEAAQKEREIRDARQAVTEAEGDLRDAKKRSDEDYVKAQQETTSDLVRAGVDRLKAETAFADAILTGKLKVDDVSTALQQLVDQGIIPQAVKDEFVGKMGSLTTQAGLAAAALQQLANVPKFQPGGAPTGLPGLPGSNVYGPPTPGTVSRSFIGPPAPGQTYQNRTIPAVVQVGPDPLGPIRSLPAKPYTDDELRFGVKSEVERLVNAANWSALIDIMKKRAAKFPGFQYGGIVGGLGGTDSQLIWATPGEGVVNPNGMRAIGSDGLANINAGRVPVAADAGKVEVVTESDVHHWHIASTDPDRVTSLAQRKFERSRRNRARRRAGAR